MVKRVLAMLAFVSFLAGTSLAFAEDSSAQIDANRITQTLRGFVDRGSLIGVSALVTIDGKEAYFGAFGLADREAHRPMARDTIVRIYSMTKPITGVALMQLWEKGKFRMDDPVSMYVPELANVKVLVGVDAAGKPILAEPKRPMTIRDLTRHTAGLTYGKSKIAYMKELDDSIKPLDLSNTLDEFARRLGTMPLEFQPGERWRYSYAADVQALLVQRLSGEPYDVYVREHILKPLKMNDTGISVAPERRERLAVMYQWESEGKFIIDTKDKDLKLNVEHHPLTPGGYGLTSTLDDYTRFARMLLNGGSLDGVKILRPDTVRMMTTSQLDPAITDHFWLLTDKGAVGFGIDLAVRLDAPKPGEKAGEVGEFFWDGAANTLFWCDPKNKLTAVLFTQYKDFGKVPLHREFRAAVYAGVDPSALPGER